MCVVLQLLWRGCVLRLSSSITQEALQGRAERANLASPLLPTLERDTDLVSAVRHVYNNTFYPNIQCQDDFLHHIFALIAWEILEFIFNSAIDLYIFAFFHAHIFKKEMWGSPMETDIMFLIPPWMNVWRSGMFLKRCVCSCSDVIDRSLRFIS